MYKFNYESESGREHDLAASVTITPGDPGDRSTPPSGPDIEVDFKKVIDGANLRYHSLVYMLRGKKTRLLPFAVADAVSEWLLANKSDDILEESGRDYEDAKYEAAEARADSKREREFFQDR